MPNRILAAASILLLAVSASADEGTTSRLATIGQVWGAVKYAHPYMGYRTDIDWDGAAVEAAAGARTSEPLPDVIARMLGRLADPMTRVESDCAEKTVAVPEEPAYTTLADGVVLLPYRTLTSADIPSAVETAIVSSKTVVFDLRLPEGRCSGPDLAAMTRLAELLVPGSFWANLRKLHHEGYRSQNPALDVTSYRSYFVSETILSTGSAAANPPNAIFIVDSRSELPPLAVTLVHAQRASILSVGSFHESFPGGSITVPIGGGYHAVVRGGELVDQKVGWSVQASTVMPASSSTDAVRSAARAMALTHRRRPAGIVGRASSTPLPAYAWHADANYADMKYPSFEYRALAAFRLWNVIHFFYAYLSLIGDWDARLPQMIDEITAAQSQSEYELALAHVMTWVPDGHSQMQSLAWMTLRGFYGPPFRLMPVEGKPVVVEILDATAAGPVQPGDELLSVDGVSVDDRRAQLDRYVAGATDSARNYTTTLFLAYAASASDAVHRFRRPDGSTYEATLHRGSYGSTDPRQHWKVLPGNIGYVDLRWLEAIEVDLAIDSLMDSRGLVIDLRGYPLGVFDFLGWRLNTVGPSIVARMRMPMVTGGNIGSRSYMHDIGSRASAVYRGRTVTLIDERAISQSEHTCLVLEALNKTSFVGSATAGSNGGVTSGVLPGGNYFLFTGLDVRHLDGRQLQRVGIIPDVEVPRTIDALRQGRDEVLERAIQLLSQ